jgi:hypothetical protein
MSESSPPAGRSYMPPAAWPGFLLAAASLLGAGWLAHSPQFDSTRSLAAPAVVLQEGLFVLVALLALAGWGAFPARWLYARPDSLRRFLIAIGLGWGLVAVLTLALGAVGLLTKLTAGLLAAGGLCAGVVALIRSPAPPPSTARIGLGGVLGRTILLAPLAFFGAYALFLSILPPGVIWDAEGNGYDVLEYHLNAPREYYDAGRIEFLPHNVYASFPQNVEILYLWMMHGRGGPHDAAIAAQLLHLSFGVLTVLALAAWSPPGWGRIIALLAAGGVPWLTYVGCLAYVELGLLFLSALAAGLLLEHVETAGTPTAVDSAVKSSSRDGSFTDEKATRRLIILAGLFAGMAGGVKYTALALVAALLAVCWTLARRGAVRPRLRDAAIFTAAATIAFAPWAIRNAAFTGNPVYPFAYEWFGGAAWSAEQAAQWARGHALPANQSRATLAFRETIGSTLFGVPIFVLAALGAMLRRDRGTVLLIAWSLGAVAVWAAVTHMPGRFLVPVVAPLALLAARAGRGLEPAGGLSTRTVGSALAAVAFLGAGWNAFQFRTIVRDQDASLLRRTNVGLAAWVDNVDARLDVEPLNEISPDDATRRLWIIGNAATFYVRDPHHYTVVFNRDPWLQKAVEGAGPAELLEDLRRRGVTHVVCDWREVDRLRRTYGFPDIVTRDWFKTLEAAGLKPVRGAQAERPSAIQVWETPARSSE